MNGNVWKWVAGVLGVALLAAGSAFGGYVVGQLQDLDNKMTEHVSEFKEFKGEVKALLRKD